MELVIRSAFGSGSASRSELRSAALAAGYVFGYGVDAGGFQAVAQVSWTEAARSGGPNLTAGGRAGCRFPSWFAGRLSWRVPQV